jgi:hypothetical protein
MKKREVNKAKRSHRTNGLQTDPEIKQRNAHLKQLHAHIVSQNQDIASLIEKSDSIVS